jgi:hypothetical protein
MYDVSVSARAARTAQAIGAVALAAAILARVVVSWSDGTHLSYAEGVWAALAVDAAHGEWYRPISGPDGYGGTRYWPLVFGVHGLLLRILPDVVMTGLLLGAAAFTWATFALFGLARAFGLAGRHAALAALIFASSTAAQYGMLAIRGDLLPLALLLSGAAIGFASPIAAAILITLAILGKPTMVYGLLALAAWYAMARDWRALRTFAIALAIGLGVATGVMQWLSDGRALSMLLSGASAGASPGGIWRAPLSFARALTLVPETALTIGAGLAIGGLAWRARSLGARPAAWLFACALAATMAVFATPGTWMNHFADLQAAAALLIAIAVARTEGAWKRGAAIVAAGALAGGIAATTLRAAGPDRSDRLRSYQLVLDWLDDHPGDILADQLMLPVLAGRRSFVIDSMILRAHLDAGRLDLRPLLSAVEKGRFVAVILDEDVPATSPQALIARSEFGAAYMRALLERYRVERVVAGRTILVPKNDPAMGDRR